MKDDIVNYAILHTYFEIIFIHMFGPHLKIHTVPTKGSA